MNVGQIFAIQHALRDRKMVYRGCYSGETSQKHLRECPDGAGDLHVQVVPEMLMGSLK